MFIIPAVSEVAFRVGNFPIYCYGVVMALAIFVGITIANRYFNKVNKKNKDIIIEYAPLIIFLGIFGARLYFCCLNPSYYFSHPMEILDIREGGLSIHGGIAGGIAALIFVAQRKKISFWSVVDPLACGTILGQAIGRWGNYFNSEAYGLPVASQNWGLFIPVHARVEKYMNFSLFHPAFLYESLLDLSAFFVITYLYFRFGKTFNGLTFFIYLIFYSIIRFFVECIRVDSALNIGTIPIAEIVSIILFLIGLLGCLTILFVKKTTT